MNKEERSKYNKKWNEANKEKISAYNKAYRKANKKKLIAQQGAFIEAKKDGLYTVYLLVNENYVGMTTVLYTRLSEHKSRYKRNVENVKILGKYENKREALDVERSYHDKGYKGINKIYKKRAAYSHPNLSK